MTECLWRTGK